MNIALQVHVDTYRGTVEGIPPLLALFKEFNIQATFLFSLGPDNTGRALKRVFRPGFLSKVSRTSVVKHYGIRTLMYGVFLPGPDIAKKAGHIMRACKQDGHEVGIHCYDHVRWQDNVANKDAAWTAKELSKAENAFIKTFDEKPSTIGAAGWQVNQYTIAIEEKMGFQYATDTRGKQPFFPKMGDIESSCLQIPTTLPTLDELIGQDELTEDNVADAVFKLSREALPYGHVYTLHAELEGLKLIGIFRELIEKWQKSGDKLISLQKMYQSLPLDKLPRKAIEMKEIEGRSGVLAMEGI